MTKATFDKLTERQLEKMDFQDLKAIVAAQSKSANKRVRRIQQNVNASQQAVRNVEESGGMFHVGGKTSRAAMVKEAQRIQRFNRAKTGTVRGAVSVKMEAEKRATGQSSKEAGKKAESDYIKSEHKKLKESGKKLTKKKEASIKNRAKTIREKAETKVRKETEKQVKAWEKSRDNDVRKARGRDYYSSQSKGMSKDNQNVYKQSDSDSTFMEQEEEHPVSSPLDLSSNDESDDDFVVANEEEIPGDFKVV